MTVDPDAIIAEGVKAAARQERVRNLILGVLLLFVGVVFGAIGLYALSTPMFFSMSEAVFGCFLGALFGLMTGTIQLVRGLCGRPHPS